MNPQLRCCWDFKIAINGEFYNKTLSGYHDKTGQDVITAKANLGIFKLEKGTNTITLKTVGKHKKAEPRYMVGIDLLKLVKVE